MSEIKDAVRQVMETLPEDATWDDVEYHLYVRRKIENGLKDIAEGRTLSMEEVRQRLDKWIKDR
jgi:predicted transcriptional regulator